MSGSQSDENSKHLINKRKNYYLENYNADSEFSEKSILEEVNQENEEEVDVL